MSTNIEPLLRAVTSIIREHCEPEQIVLFGSCAKGGIHRGSDLDLLVVGTFAGSRWIRDRELRDALSQLPIAIDLHCLTRDELAIESAKIHSYLNTMQESCRILYRRSSEADNL